MFIADDKVSGRIVNALPVGRRLEPVGAAANLQAGKAGA